MEFVLTITAKHTNQNRKVSKWRLRLENELRERAKFLDFSCQDWKEYLRKRKLTSSNYDTIVSVDWMI